MVPCWALRPSYKVEGSNHRVGQSTAEQFHNNDNRLSSLSIDYPESHNCKTKEEAVYLLFFSFIPYKLQYIRKFSKIFLQVHYVDTWYSVLLRRNLIGPNSLNYKLL